MVGRAEPKLRKGRLKVFRTAIGFHDAYVAAPSRKAALAAWGTDKDLFARGVAEEVSDPALMEEPLTAPGTVFRQMRAMPPQELEPTPRKATKRKASSNTAAKTSMQPVPPPPPSDEEVDEAQRALDAARKQQEREQRDLASRERELANERRAVEVHQAKELRRLQERLKAARHNYEAKLTTWQNAVR